MLPLLLLTHSTASPALDIVQRGIDAMGGDKRLASIQQISQTTVGHEYMVEQSERPTGPFLIIYYRRTQTLTFDTLGLTEDRKMQGITFGGDTEFPSKKSFVEPKIDSATVTRLMTGPERVMLLAKAASDLKLGPDISFHNVPHKSVQFHWGKVPIQVLLNAYTGTPTAVDVTQVVQESFWPVWGDATSRIVWGSWDLQPGGVMLPTQWTREINGYAVSDDTILKMAVTMKPADAPKFLPPVPPRQIDGKLYFSRYKTQEVAKGIIQWQGGFNTNVVDLGTSLAVIDPVINSSFGKAFLDKLAEQYPGKKVSAVIPTDDAWPHFGGSRAFAAADATFYSLDLNEPILRRYLDAPYTTLPDDWQMHASRKARIVRVAKPTPVGTGPNAMVLYPMHGLGSERMQMVYFPALKLLYASDLLQPQGEEFFAPQYPRELVDAVEREHLDVQTVFAQHMGPTPWKKITDFVAKMKGG